MDDNQHVPSAAALLGLLQQFTVETDRYVEAVSSSHDLHRTDLNALAAMVAAAREGRTMTPGALRTALNLSSPATTALVDRLDRAGHLARHRSEKDRRQVHLEMTDSARATGSQLFSPLASAIAPVIGALSPEELHTVMTFMQGVIEATVAARKDVTPSHEPSTGVTPDVPVTHRAVQE
ncbi:MarR family winged helix-turn-helix transcriptional regulator [Arthrobacter sp. MA-N2]|uniref:MarR family winged helix-turn-helix transcriptional regulator n=1 Tax=Arthrobacter sp. MA-N2 TaxID=1101188 RepID=UPI0004B27F69|nr:MarR family transcriptional regulator [Arthrobacter sp. MA-N2]